MKKKTLFKNMRRTLPLCVIFLVAGLVSCNNALDAGTELPWEIVTPPDSLEATDSVRACITGMIVEIVVDYQHLKDYNPQRLKEIEDNVFIGGLKFSEEDEKQYGYIETILVPKEKFPIKDYRIGDVISFKISKIISSYHGIRTNPIRSYTCEIELYE